MPLFVTWYKNRLSGNKNEGSRTSGESLRGCIGTFQADANETLGQVLKSYAVISSQEDTRFPPVTLNELPRLKCTVTLLHTFEPIEKIEEVELGKHGIKLTITKTAGGRKGRVLCACFLPSVPVEAGNENNFRVNS